MKYYLQGEAASILKVSRYTLVDLEEKGVIPKAKRLGNGYRYYFKSDLFLIAESYYGKEFSKIVSLESLEE